MKLEELRAGLEGLSEAQLKLIVEVAWGELLVEKKELLIKFAESMRRGNEKDKRGRG